MYDKIRLYPAAMDGEAKEADLPIVSDIQLKVMLVAEMAGMALCTGMMSSRRLARTHTHTYMPLTLTLSSLSHTHRRSCGVVSPV